MYYLARFFEITDLLLFPYCFLLLFYFLWKKAKKQKEESIKKLYLRAFYFRVICVFAFVLLTEFYFKGGDTALYFQALKDLRAAVSEDLDNLWVALINRKLDEDSPLYKFFYLDNYLDDITYAYMFVSTNYTVPRFALIPSYIFFNSYLCICMFFAFFALGGCIRLFKTFYYYYPELYRPLAFACFFLPSVTFWSSTYLKDTISFGCVGYITYAFFNIIVRKRKIMISLFIILLFSYILLLVKTYILLVLTLALLVWLFTEFSEVIHNKVLRILFSIMTFVVGAFLGYVILNFLTSLEATREYQLEKLVDLSKKQRELYNYVAIYTGVKGSNFSISSQNPLLLVLAGFSATFFRPFLWEVTSPIVILAAFESSIFLFLTIYFIFKKGFFSFLKLSFTDPRMLMCFVFAFVFATSVGISTTNFGALSRYKIVCMPFYLIWLTLMYQKMNLNFPTWFNKILNLAVPLPINKYVRHSRVG